MEKALISMKSHKAEILLTINIPPWSKKPEVFFGVGYINETITPYRLTSMGERCEMECTEETSMLQELFDFKLTRINEDPSNFSLCNSILKAIQIDELLQDIRPLSRKDEMIGNAPSIFDLVKPGSVFVFAVVVFPDKHGLQIKERV